MKLLTRAWMVCGLLAAASAWAQDWKPERNVEVIVPSGPGGGTDKTGRTVQLLLQNLKLVDRSVVVNKSGAAGRLGMLYLNQHAGDGHYIAVSTVTLLTNYITGASNITHTDVTPVAQLFSEYILFAVRADSPVRSGPDMVERLKQDPQSLSVGVTAVGGTSHMVTGLVVSKAGGDARRLKMVVFKAGGEVTTALLGGHVDVVPAPVANLLPHIKSGSCARWRFLRRNAWPAIWQRYPPSANSASMPSSIPGAAWSDPGA